MKAGEEIPYLYRFLSTLGLMPFLVDRLACVFAIIPIGTEMLYFFHRDGKVEQYRSNLAFFFEENPEQGPGSLELMGEG